jgi:Phage tail protein
MLNRVEVTNAQGQILTLPLEAYNDGYLLAEVEGLDPVKATLVSSSFANLDGEQQQSARREARNIILHLDLLLGYGIPISALRRNLYNFFMTKSTVQLTFYQDDGPTVEIIGVVETCEAPQFSKEPVATISIICHKPDFLEPTSIVLSNSTTSDINSEYLINYAGTVETGILLTMNVNRSLSSFTVMQRSSDGTIGTMEFIAPLVANDVLSISSVPRAKGANLNRAGSDSSILYAIPGYSSWITLYPGPNYFRVYTTGAAVPYTIEYTNRYGAL